MGTATGAMLIAQARGLLQDAGSALQRWSDAELLTFLHDAELALVTARPDTLVSVVTHTCGAEARQSLPPDGIFFVDCLRNVNGHPITRVDRAVLDRGYPQWVMDTGTVVEHVMQDLRDPTHFWVYPVCDGANVELTYTPTPPLLPQAVDPINVADHWAPALADYMAYRALASDLDNPANQAVAGGFYQAFLAKVQAQGAAKEVTAHG